MNTGTLLNIVSLSLSFIPDIVTLLILSHVYCHSIWTSQLDFRRAPGLAQSAVCPGPGCSGWWTTWCWPLARGHFLYMAQSLHFSWICLWNIGQQLVSPSLVLGLGKWMKSDTLHRIPDVHRTFVSRLVATSNTYANFLSLVSHPRSITHQSLSKITKCPPVKSFQAVTLSDSRHWTGLIELCTDRWVVLCLLAWPGTACQNAGAVTSMSEKGR